MSKNDPHAIPPSSAADGVYGSDLSLARRLVQGDGQAWQTFIGTYGRLIRARVADVATSFGRGRDEDAIDDATADVMAALLHNRASTLRAFAGKSTLATYVAVISTRTATHIYAARQRIVTDSLEGRSCVEHADPKFVDPSRNFLATEQQAQVRRVIRALPPKQREVINLFHLQGCSYIEVSQKMQIPLGSVGVTLRRAEAKMKELLEPD